MRNPIFSCAGLVKEKKVSPPNIIIFLVDDQGWNGTSLQMDNNDSRSKSDFLKTPNLELLGAKGMRFSNAYAAAPVCAPSRYAIQFGMTPARMKLIRVGMHTGHIDHKNPNVLAKIIKQANPNYLTAHFGKWGMGSNPKTMGYDESDGPTTNFDGGFQPNKKQWKTSFKTDPKKIYSLSQKALLFIEKAKSDKRPFFLQISHYAVHSNIETREKTFTAFKSLNKNKSQKGYASMTSDLDKSLGMILEKIKALDIDKNTYIIYTSDNGAVPRIPIEKEL